MIPGEHRRVSALDGVRGLAIALILVHHAIQFSAVQGGGAFDRWLGQMGGELWIGVDLFFVLSGYLITGILLRTRQQPLYFRNFYARRTLRIFPLYYAMVFAMCVALPRLFHRPYLDDLSAHQAWYWLYLPNFRIFLNGDWLTTVFDHTWSLAIEEQFYLVWPIMVFLVGPRRLISVAAVMVLGSGALRLYLAGAGYAEPQIRVLPFSHWEGIGLGAMLASFRVLAVPATTLRNLSLAAMAGGGLARLLLPWLVPGGGVMHMAVAGLAWTFLFAGALGLIVIEPDGGPVGRLLSIRPLAFLGTYSYGLYIFHFPAMNWMAPYLGKVEAFPATLSVHAAVLLAVAGLATTLLAWASYHAFEMPFLRLKSRFEPERSGEFVLRRPDGDVRREPQADERGGRPLTAVAGD